MTVTEKFPAAVAQVVINPGPTPKSHFTVLAVNVAFWVMHPGVGVVAVKPVTAQDTNGGSTFPKLTGTVYAEVEGAGGTVSEKFDAPAGCPVATVPETTMLPQVPKKLSLHVPERQLPALQPTELHIALPEAGEQEAAAA